MNTFPKIKANKNSLSRRSLVEGVGTNDAWYMVKPLIDGVQFECSAHRRWSSMIKRCYSHKNIERRPNYKECTVCDEWLTFSNFAKWYDENAIDGWQLDKDIKIKGNKVYSPSGCLFVPMCINYLMCDSLAVRGKYPVGVIIDNRTNKFQARIRIDGKHTHIGVYETEGVAYAAYAYAKNNEIKRKMTQYPQFAKYLINHLLEVAC